MSSCSIIAKVKNPKNGEIVSSRLHKDLLLLSANDREIGNNMYLNITDEEFRNKYSAVESYLDEYNEPKIEFLLWN